MHSILSIGRAIVFVMPCFSCSDLGPLFIYSFFSPFAAGCFDGVDYEGKDIVFKFIIEYIILRDFGP
jgi:hypothetical protein